MWYPKGTIIEIVAELHDKSDQEAGDIEWWWADRLGYKRGQHYASMTQEQRSQAGRNGGKIGGPKGGKARAASLSKERLSEIGRNAALKCVELGRAFRVSKKRRIEINRASAKMRSPEEKARTTSKAGKAAAAQRKSGFFKIVVCPHCGLSGSVGVLKRWHFDNCRYKDRPKPTPLPCMCGCGELAAIGKSYVQYHHLRVR